MRKMIAPEGVPNLADTFASTAGSRRSRAIANMPRVDATAAPTATAVISSRTTSSMIRTSVVDPNLRAHDVPNLYLVGSGCFVTASASPPTLTIAALAIRASEHIAAGLRPSGPTNPALGAEDPVIVEPPSGPRINVA